MSITFNEKFRQVISHKDILIENKIKLQDNIHQVDQKKKQTILRCFKLVNENFSKIFSKLLNRADARLVLKTYQDKKTKQSYEGIEINIKLGGQWKESLSELSGGQRTLLALSFLLALLRFNGAPFYIFDEVDAALDESHTENLGYLIKSFFSSS